MAAINEYLKCRSEYNIAHIKLLFTFVSPYGPLPKDTIDGGFKNTLTQAGMNTVTFSTFNYL